MSERQTPQLWSDFDGTAVETVSKFNPRNWSKYPLAGIPNYDLFLHGVLNEDVRVAGIVSRRPNIAPRRYVTTRSVAKLGLSNLLLLRPNQIVLAGSEEGKAEHIVKQGRDGTKIGIIDDKPHRVGPALLDALLREETVADDRQAIALGVVAHSKSEEYTDRFLSSVTESDRDVQLSSVDGHPTFVGSSGFRLSVIQLEPYGVEAGNQFAHQIHAL